MEGIPALFQLPSPDGLDALIQVIRDLGYLMIGPRVEDGVVSLGPVECARDLPRDMRDVQDKAFYRLGASAEPGFFGFNLGPKSWKSYLFPSERKLWTMAPGEAAQPSSLENGEPPPYACLGVRACELAAIRVQDKILCGDDRDPVYTRRRRAALIIGVHCQTAAATCFCTSMGTGPEFSASGYDLLLTEFPDFFLAQSGSSKGDEILTKLASTKVTLDLSSSPDLPELKTMISAQLASTREQIVRRLPQENIKEDIYRALDSSHWQEVAQRCLACANCTMVCPTCFCSTHIDTKTMTADGKGEQASRTLTWDSCFHLDFSLMHGGHTRTSIASRYRQWLSHKLATWIDQFGTSGCVGCGRCITWCPVGIDLTEEIAHLRIKTVAPESLGKS